MKRFGTLALASAVAGLIAAAVAYAGLPIICGGGPCNGTADADEIQGTDDPDQINGRGGSDNIDANDGADTIRGGPGSDETDGDGGNDKHFGGPGIDQLSEFGGPTSGGADLMKGGKGNDFIEGHEQGDRIYGGKGNDRVAEIKAPRAIAQRGGPPGCFRGFCSNLYGDEGPDQIFGGRGNDFMEGEEGADLMDGGPGDDAIDASNEDTQGARDRIFCGPGNDFAFVNPEDKVADDCEHVRPPLAIPFSARRGGDPIRVTRTDDPVPDGCLPSDCSLREAVILANLGGSPDVIVLGAKTYSLTIGGAGEDDAETGDLDVDAPVAFQGKGFGKSVIAPDWAGEADRMLEIHGDADVAGSGVTLRDAVDTGDNGSAVLIPALGSLTLRSSRVVGNRSQYGAISNEGAFKGLRVLFKGNIAGNCCSAFYNECCGVATATLRKVAFVRNRAPDDTGAVYSDGISMTIRDSLFQKNRAGDQGGAMIASGGSQVISNVTFSGNLSDSFGGALVIEDGEVTLNNVTMTGNVADADNSEDPDDDGGAIYNDGADAADVTIVNSIIAGNRDLSGGGPDCAGTGENVFTSLGFNLIGRKTACTFGRRRGDGFGNPGLAPLRDNGGFTKTHALKRRSKAVNGGSGATPGSASPKACEKRDQRGVKRPQGRRCDIGAYERR